MRTALECFNFLKSVVNELNIPLEDLTCDDFSYDDGTFAFIFEQDDFKFRYGATRGCFIVENNENLIFKFDFSDVSEPYCSIEEDIYQEACVAGLGDVFLPVNLYGTIDNTLIYVQPKVDRILGFDFDIPIDEYDDICHRINEILKAQHLWLETSMRWLRDFYLYYGDDMFQEFCTFIDDHYINDLHDGNIGYVHGRPVIFDYAGFEESSS